MVTMVVSRSERFKPHQPADQDGAQQQAGGGQRDGRRVQVARTCHRQVAAGHQPEKRKLKETLDADCGARVLTRHLSYFTAGRRRFASWICSPYSRSSSPAGRYTRTKYRPAPSPGTLMPFCARAIVALPHRAARLVHDFQTVRRGLRQAGQIRMKHEFPAGRGAASGPVAAQRGQGNRHRRPGRPDGAERDHHQQQTAGHRRQRRKPGRESPLASFRGSFVPPQSAARPFAWRAGNRRSPGAGPGSPRRSAGALQRARSPPGSLCPSSTLSRSSASMCDGYLS